MNRKAGKVKPSSITRNSSPSGKTLTLGYLKWIMPGVGWLGLGSRIPLLGFHSLA